MKLFVVGAARVGTTMMSRILGQHPRVHALREVHLFEELWQPRGCESHMESRRAIRVAARLLQNERDGYVSPLAPKRHMREAESICDDLNDQHLPRKLFEVFIEREAEFNGREITCNQTPRDVYYLEKILGRFQDAYAG